MINVVTAVNNDEVFENNLARSPLFDTGTIPLFVEKGHKSASAAYNSGLMKTDSDIVVFAHQDVYFPVNWQIRLLNSIYEIEEQNRKWGVIGLIGKDRKNRLLGRSWSTGLNKDIRADFNSPSPTVSIDELVIVLNNNADLKFDEDLPGYHLYGTDIVQTAKQKGFEAYVIDAPVVHNSVPVLKLNEGYVKAYKYMQRKWKKHLPIPTTIVPVTRFGWPLKKKRFRKMLKSGDRGRHIRLEDASTKARMLGYE